MVESAGFHAMLGTSAMMLVLSSGLSGKSEVSKELSGQGATRWLGIFPSAKLSIQSPYLTLSQRNINITIQLLSRRQNEPAAGPRPITLHRW